MTRITLANWKAKGLFFSHRGYRIFSRVEGPAPAPVLLLIHGFPTASWDWEAIWPALTRHYRVMTLDMIGFGFSDKPMDYPYSIMDQADIFERLLAEHQVQSYHLLAHDYGDTVAQELLARHNAQEQPRPQLGSVCFLNGGLFPESHRPLLIQKLLRSPIGPILARLNSRNKLADSMQRVFGPNTQPDAELIDGFWQLISTNKGARLLPKLLHYIPERRQHRTRWVGAIQQATIPVKVIDGIADPVSGGHMVERYRALIPKPNVTALQNIGHYPQVEDPQGVLDAYIQFRLAKTES
ncbi:alpha/beta hydrolase [Aquirhabdus parva]|uniref:Alpha/beta hydrolase n=2 Tax=Aquirhabdus parva TaxID=2283318 RepID=A0A345PBS7_9GAMM|nr:alpha/beta hydrolase [Aquirhabdus parva]